MIASVRTPAESNNFWVQGNVHGEIYRRKSRRLSNQKMLTGKRLVVTFLGGIKLKLSSEIGCIALISSNFKILKKLYMSSVSVYVRAGIISVPYEKAEINVSKHILRHIWSKAASLSKFSLCRVCWRDL